MRFSLKTLLLAVLVIAVVIVAYLAMNPAPVAVDSAKVVRGPLRVTVQEDGKTRISEKYTVSAAVSGRISRIELRPGDYCTEQTLLAVILPRDPAMLDARAKAEAAARVQAAAAHVERAKSTLQQTQINFQLNESKFERAKKLLPSRAVSQTEYDIAKAEWLASEQAIATAKFEQEIAHYELEMAKAALEQFSFRQSSEEANQVTAEDPSVQPFEIYAPIAGRVLQVFQESSAVIDVGTPLIELGDPSNLEIEIDVLSTDAVRIQPGSQLTIEHWGGDKPLKGYVRVVEPAAFTKVSSLGVEEQRVNVIADFSEPPERIQSLGDGYRVEASIVVNEVKDALLVPNSALFRHQRQWHTLAIVNREAVLQAVTVGVQGESQTQIIGGLNEGDRVIVYPSDSLAPGTRVRYADSVEAATSPPNN